MLSIPFKKTDASIDVAGPLRRYLIKEFSQEEAEKYSDDLKDLQHSRHMAMDMERPSDEARESLTQYAAKLEAAEAVFPTKETEARFVFQWADAFNPIKKSSQGTLRFERACVLYNLGALESRCACDEDRGGEMGLKAAGHRFQVASGVFQYIRERMVGSLVGTLTQDLIPDGLIAASILMLAQAQACFYEKAVKDRLKTKLKPAIIAKLAAQAGEFYLQTGKHMQGPNLAPGLDTSWPAHVDFQSTSFAAAAYYWQSVSCHEVAEETGSGYGPEIAYLREATRTLTQALRSARRNNLSSTFTASASTLLGTIDKDLKTRERDNSSIYVELIPDKTAIHAIRGVSMVKALPFFGQGEPAAEQPSLFAGLLPPSAKAPLSDYKRKEAEVVGSLDATAKERSTYARSQLAAVGLPETVEAYCSTGGVPESLWIKVLAVTQDNGGLPELKAKVAEVEASAERARVAIKSVERTLNDDEQLDITFRERYSGYTGMSTTELAKDLRRDVEHYTELLQTARQADSTVMMRIDEPSHREDLELLGLERAALDAAMPTSRGAGADDDHPSKVQTAVLSAMLVELAMLIEDRDAKVVALSDLVKNNNVTSELAEVARAGGAPEAYSRVVELAIQKLTPFRDDIENNINTQGPLLEKIIAENERFQHAKASDQPTLDREAFLQRLHRSIAFFHEVHAQLTEGSTFYTDLLHRLAQLKQTCEDLVYTQGLQRRSQEGELASIELAYRIGSQVEVQSKSENTERPTPTPDTTALLSAGYFTPTGADGGDPQEAFKPGQASPSYDPKSQSGQQGHVPWNYNPGPSTARSEASASGGIQSGQRPHHNAQAPVSAPTLPNADWGPWVHVVHGKEHVSPQPVPVPGRGPSDAGDPKCQRLVEMGFDPVKARAALAECKGDEGAAINNLLSEG